MFEIDKKTFCVIGHPIGHTLSPAIHQTVYEVLELDFKYSAVHVFPDRLSDFIREARKTGCPGFNVTVPHKEAVISFLDEVDFSAGRIGAVNTVKQDNDLLKGFNTDVFGMIAALKQGGWSPQGKVICLGAGGAARAAIEAMSLMGARELVLFDIIQERTDKLIQDFQGKHSMNVIQVVMEADLNEYLKEADLLINATPVGMWPNLNDSPVRRPDYIASGATVFDLVYKPLKTRLMREGEQQGCKTISGLGMLIAQALAADEIWLNQEMPDGILETVWEKLRNQI
ncbi:shikimate dehydrogenase [bacterium]|nr:shikimate dehydrogenase [bacterium]